MWDWTLERLWESHPHAADFFAALPQATSPGSCSVRCYFETLTEEQLQDVGMERRQLEDQFMAFMTLMDTLDRREETVESLTILGGVDKDGRAEELHLTIRTGEIITLVGPTGAGKSRLLGDIEWVAQRDTPTGRQILLNGKIPDSKYRFSLEHKLVAQLSQNMNFVMDIRVGEFIAMHAESRLVPHIPETVEKIIGHANRMAGEAFGTDTPVTALSGGQSRALMIADTAHLSASPIVLIDEIENAGIDRRAALELLVGQQKIVLMATHDPALALLGDKRLVIKNGAVASVLTTSGAERRCLARLLEVDEKLARLRQCLRDGGRINALPDFF